MSPADGRSDGNWLAAFTNRRVLVTGHTGFKGSWLSTWLAALGAEVHGLSLPAEEASLFKDANLADVVMGVDGDIRNLETVDEVFAAAQPEVVFHLAAQSLVRKGYADPVETYATNVMGTVNVLDAARRSPGLRAVVVVTSDKCYENRETLWSYREPDQLGGRDPYSSSKGCAELVTSAYRRSFFDHPSDPLVASARAGNVIGGGDWSEDRLVPDIVRAIGNDQPVLIRNPDSVRPWQHVLEPVRGYLMLAAQLLDGRRDLAAEWNFGPAEEETISVKNLTQAILDEWGVGAMTVKSEDQPPHEAAILRLDITKARLLLGYRPLIGLPLAIRMAVAWYSQHKDHPERARELTERQIEEYAALLA